jgi:hypothetical protein
LDGPAETAAPARKCVRVSQATVSLVHSREECFLPDRLKK